MKRLSSIVPGIFMIVVGVVAAVILYRVGFAMPSGPSGPSDRQTLLDYNRCLSVATSSGAIDTKALQKCGELLANSPTIDDFSKARMDEMRWKLVKGDFEQTDGDIFPILGKVDTSLNIALESAKQALLAPPTPATKPSVFEAITESWKLLRSALFNQPT